MITATFVGKTTVSNMSVDIEVRDSANNKSFQKLYTAQDFTAGTSKVFATTWKLPSALPAGTYTVKTGVFNADWSTGYGWNDQAATVSVGAAPTATPTAGPTQSPTARPTSTPVASPTAAPASGTYYVDCAGSSDSNAGTSPGQAWASLAKANSAPLKPGQSLLLKRGCTWSGPLNATWTGTASQPITISAYGTGALPRIAGSAPLMINVTGSYQVIDSLAVSATPDHIDAGCRNQPVGYRHGVEFKPNAQHNHFQNSDLTSLSVGVELDLGSTYNSVTRNVFHGVNMMFTLTPQSVNDNDDGGAQNLLIEGDYNDIGYNTITGGSACMYDYQGQAGTAFVLYGGQHNLIHHNQASGNGANFAEAGANVGAGQRAADDNTFAYNLSTGGQFFSAHGHGDFWGPTLNTKLYNNVSYTTGGGAVSCNGCGTDVLTMRNNIIWADGSATLYVDAPIDEANDIFWNNGGSPYNSVPISSTSKVANPQFVNPGVDFHLQASSPAINAGSAAPANAGNALDFAGKASPQGGAADIGIYEMR